MQFRLLAATNPYIQMLQLWAADPCKNSIARPKANHSCDSNPSLVRLNVSFARIDYLYIVLSVYKKTNPGNLYDGKSQTFQNMTASNSHTGETSSEVR